MHMSNQIFRSGSRWLAGAALGAGLALSAGAQTEVFAPGVMKVEFFTGLDGVDINTLLDADKYRNNQPDAVQYRTSFSSPDGYGDNYGARVSGFITPTESGDYDFFIRADDQAQLYVSTDDKPANGQLVAQEIAACCEAFKEPGVGEETTAAPISLVANRRYAVYAVMKEGGGGDWMQVAWRKTTDTTAAGNLPILSGSVIGAFAPAGTVTITDQPDSVATIEGVYATFSATTTHTGVAAPGYQWRKNGADIAGATSSSYTTPLLTLADNGAKYTVKVTVPGAEVISAEATLTVTADTIPPKVVSAGGVRKGTGIEVGVIFDETVDAASLVAANFSLSAGTVSGARHVPNSSGKTSLEDGAILTTTGLTAGSSYQLTVTGVKDAKGNTMAATTVPFTVSSMTYAALGTEPAEFPAAAIAVGDDGFNVNSGGNAFWGTQDDVTFVYEEVTGDFDKVARVEYQDASSQWARTGLHARDSLIGAGEEASRFQNTHVNPTIKADGTASNFSHETNRRLNKGGATTSSGGGGTPTYPNAWVRLRRAGDVMHMYRSADATTWYQLGISDFNPADGSNADGPLANRMYVGMVFGPENGNNTEGFRENWAARFRDYGNYTPNKPRGSQAYSIGVAFGRSEANAQGSWMGPAEVAGADPIAQSNWNNVDGANTDESGPVTGLKADVNGVAQNTTATIEWSCPNTWSSTGRGEENNMLTGSDRQLMVGYLDTGNATTTRVTVKALPSQLTGGNGYDVVVYSLGGVSGRGGGFRITDVNGTELKPVVLAASPANPTTLSKVSPTNATVHATGTYIVFSGLKVNEFILEGSTENDWGFSGTPRAGINAIQIVSPTGAIDAAKPEVAIARTATGATITYKGTLQSAPSVNGPYTDVAGATSPYAVTAAGAGAFYRTR